MLEFINNKPGVLAKPDPEAKTFFEAYRYEGGGLSQNQIERYTLQAGIFNATQQLFCTKRDTQIILNSKQKGADLWKKIAEHIGELDPERFDHRLPINHHRLKTKFNKYRKEGYIALVQRANLGTKNRRS